MFKIKPFNFEVVSGEQIPALISLHLFDCLCIIWNIQWSESAQESGRRFYFEKLISELMVLWSRAVWHRDSKVGSAEDKVSAETTMFQISANEFTCFYQTL